MDELAGADGAVGACWTGLGAGLGAGFRFCVLATDLAVADVFAWAFAD